MNNILGIFWQDFIIITKIQKSEEVYGMKKKILNWELLEENSTLNLNVKLKNNKKCNESFKYYYLKENIIFF